MSISEIKYHVPAKDKWEFDDQVTNIFDDMLSRSIPQYEVMRELVDKIAYSFLPTAGTLLDIGCSRGNQILRLLEHRPQAIYHGIEISTPMIEACREQTKDFNNVFLHQLDLRKDALPVNKFDVCLSVLTLQFIPIEYRLHLLKRIYQNMVPGGVFVLVEKVLGSSADIDQLFTDTYYDLKSDNGYSNYEIERKRLSLEGVLVPVSSDYNQQLLESSGFDQIDCFWRWCNFTGLIAIK